MQNGIKNFTKNWLQFPAQVFAKHSMRLIVRVGVASAKPIMYKTS